MFNKFKTHKRDWLSKLNLNTNESCEKPKTRKYPLKLYFGIAMLLLIIFIVCITFVASERIIKVEDQPNNGINVPENAYSFGNMKDFKVEKSETGESRGTVEYYTFTTQNSLKYLGPLEPPKSYRKQNAYKNYKNITIINFPVKTLNMEKEYLLEREDLHPINIRHQRKQKVKFPEVQNKRRNGNILTAMHIRSQIPRPPRSRRKSSRKYMREIQYPRPFNFLLDGSPPSEFQSNNQLGFSRDYRGEINNIQDILHKIQDSEDRDPRKFKHFGSVQISGKYKHLKGNGFPQLMRNILINPQSNRQQTMINTQFYADPLYPYKPQSPSEINLLATNQFPKEQFLYDQYHINDLENIYQRIIAANNYRRKKHSKSRRKEGFNSKNKPFSLMLDIYPMGEDEQYFSSSTPRPNTKKRKPFISLPSSPNSINDPPYSFQVDNSYYNGMNFPQLQNNNFPQANNFYKNTYLHNQYTDQNFNQDYGQVTYDDNKPSQIMVHLNLFPKKKVGQQNRNSNDDIISPVFDDRIAEGSEVDPRINNESLNVDYVKDKDPHDNISTHPTEVTQTVANERNNGTTSINHNSCCYYLPKSFTVENVKRSSVDAEDNSMIGIQIDANPFEKFNLSDEDVVKIQYTDALARTSAKVVVNKNGI